MPFAGTDGTPLTKLVRTRSMNRRDVTSPSSRKTPARNGRTTLCRKTGIDARGEQRDVGGHVGLVRTTGSRVP